MMKAIHSVLLVIAAAGLLFAGAGCELESTEQVRLDIVPREATLRKGESIELRAFGWHSYHWQLDGNAANGYLSATTGDTTVYTSITTNDTIQIIRVSVTPGGTNTADVTASAIITHRSGAN